MSYKVYLNTSNLRGIIFEYTESIDTDASVSVKSAGPEDIVDAPSLLGPYPVSLVSCWFVRPGSETAASAALSRLAADVQAGEPDTLTYLVSLQFAADARLQSLPPTDPNSVLFFETYRDTNAFLAHLNGPIFANFVARSGDLFVGTDGKPYTTVTFLQPHAGFVRDTAKRVSAELVNSHPSVMFEVIARDQQALKAFYAQVFGWRYDTGTGGFAYVHFPAGAPSLLGGIGQAEPATPGFAPGRNFYLLVDALQPVLDAAFAAGATALMPPTAIDGYNFAMFTDPEGNPIGIIEPFT